MYILLCIDLVQVLVEINCFQYKLVVGMQNLLKFGELEYVNMLWELVYSEDKFKVWYFIGMCLIVKMLVLIVYVLVNMVWMIDFQFDCLLVCNLFEQGEDVYLIDWGYFDGVDCWFILDDYFNGYFDCCVDVVCYCYGFDVINLLGICQGGVFLLCYMVMYLDKVKNLIIMVILVDFYMLDNMFLYWVQNFDVDCFVDVMGNILVGLMNWVYFMFKLLWLNQQKYVGLVDIFDNLVELENFLCMEKWIFDLFDQVGEVFCQFIKDFYQGNKLVKYLLEIGGCLVDLGLIQQLVFNIYVEQDYLVLLDVLCVLCQYIGMCDYIEVVFKGGYIGIYVFGWVQCEVLLVIYQWLCVCG